MSMEEVRILVVDDEPSITEMLSENLAEEGYSCVTSASGEDTLEKLSAGNYDVVLLDLKMPGISGMDVLREAKAKYADTVFIVVTSTADIETAVKAMKFGAEDYITKPFELGRVNCSIAAALKAKSIWHSRSAVGEGKTESKDEEVEWLPYIDCICEGVEAKLAMHANHSVTVTTVEKTTAIARNLGIPPQQIKRWEDAKRQHIHRVDILWFLLDKMERNLVS